MEVLAICQVQSKHFPHINSSNPHRTLTRQLRASSPFTEGELGCVADGRSALRYPGPGFVISATWRSCLRGGLGLKQGCARVSTWGLPWG